MTALDSARPATPGRHGGQPWLAAAGAGAQIVVADNAPPPTADSDVVVRFSRRADEID